MRLLELLFASSCVGCRRPGLLCCPHCAATLGGAAAVVWPRPAPPGLPPPWTVTAYDGVARDLVIAYKERGAAGLRHLLAEPLATAVLAAAKSAVTGAAVAPSVRLVVVPVPSSRRATRERGDDVVLRLARCAAGKARRQGVAVTVISALRHGRAVHDSAGLTSVARAANLAGAFVVAPRMLAVLAGAQVVLVDDVMTTGASLAESARALREAGAHVIGAATIASTRRRDAAEELGTIEGRSTVRADR